MTERGSGHCGAGGRRAPRSRARRTRRLVLVALAVFVAAALAPSAGAAAPSAGSAVPPTAAAAPSAAADPCLSTGQRPAVVATPPDERPTGPGNTVAVYRGSELVLHLCTIGRTDLRLDAGDRRGIEELHGSNDRVRVRIAAERGDGDATVESPAITSLGELAEPRDVPGPNLTVVDRAVAIALLDRPLPVDSPGRAKELRDADEAFRDRDAALEQRLAAVEAPSSDASSGALDDEPLNSTLAAHERYREAVARLRATLYAVAASDVSSARTARAIEALAEHEDARAATATERIGAYDRALVERERSLTWSLRLRVLGVGIGGLLVGTAAGAALPIYRGRAARRRLRNGEWTTYSRYTAVLPGAVGAVLLLVGLGWLALTVGWGVLEVVL